jgi:hypothetical protein
MRDKTLSLAIMLTLLMALGCMPDNTKAQHPGLKELPLCKTAEEVLSGLRAEGQLPADTGQILVAGNVLSPQSFTLETPVTVMMALAMAGGARAGSRQSIYLIRRSPGTSRRSRQLSSI